jgi:hypothetical protein
MKPGHASTGANTFRQQNRVVPNLMDVHTLQWYLSFPKEEFRLTELNETFLFYLEVLFFTPTEIFRSWLAENQIDKLRRAARAKSCHASFTARTSRKRKCIAPQRKDILSTVSTSTESLKNMKHHCQCHQN